MYYLVDEFQNEPHAILSNEIYRMLGVKDLAVLRREQQSQNYERDQHHQEKNIKLGKFFIEVETLDVSTVDQAQKKVLQKMRARQEFLE